MISYDPNWQQQIPHKLKSADEAVAQICSGQRLYLMGNAAMPKLLVAALVRRAPELHDVEIVHILTVGRGSYVVPEMEGHLRVNSQFIGGNVRKAINEGRADFTPVFLGEVPRLYRTVLKPDVALIQVSPPDEHGFCSFGVDVGVSKPAAWVATHVIAQVNSQMPRTLGDSFIHVSRLDAIVACDEPLDEVPQSSANPLEAKVGEQILDLIEDGSTLQLGIGGIPDGVLRALRTAGKRDLGIHSELFSDGIIELVEKGIITNERKSIHPGKIIAGFVLGTRDLYHYVDNNPIIELHPTDYVNDPFVIAQNYRMVAVNSAIEVDLTGQVCADSIGTRLYSGAGGQVDFIRGAARSEGGKPIIALASTTKSDTISRIVPTLNHGAGVVTSRNDVHYVVTEHGIAALYGKSLRERARALIGIAHPAFRDSLTHEAKKLNLL